ncbi:hypothetical protein C1645_821715 [Glomus cerebriforme]|uniref:Uncharacterized protein n=1 Tax=Glomus cerebriforme TaxID=658196 RepID=A0A397T050_9GLOM|nr:hypothetical protein C1645_821715 [Glomus cerebriforme]
MKYEIQNTNSKQTILHESFICAVPKKNKVQRFIKEGFRVGNIVTRKVGKLAKLTEGMYSSALYEHLDLSLDLHNNLNRINRLVRHFDSSQFGLKIRNGNLKWTMLRKLIIGSAPKRTILQESIISAASKVWSRNIKYEFEVNCTVGIDYWCCAESLVSKWDFKADCATGIIYSRYVESLVLKWDFEAEELIIGAVLKVWSQNMKYEFEADHADAIDKTGQIKLSNSISVLHKEMPDNYSKNKSTDDNDNEEEPLEDEMIFNNTSFITYDKLFD